MTDSQPNGQLTDLLATRHRVNCPVTVNRWLANRPVNRAFVQRAYVLNNVRLSSYKRCRAELATCYAVNKRIRHYRQLSGRVARTLG